jgi:hypothetical protein
MIYLFVFKLYYITFLIYNAKISDNNAESGKVPRMLAALFILNEHGRLIQHCST